MPGQGRLISLKLDMRRLDVKVQSFREGYNHMQFSGGAVLPYAVDTLLAVLTCILIMWRLDIAAQCELEALLIDEL